MFSTSGDIHLNSSYDRLGDTNGFQHPAGQHGYVSIIHEVGHAVGLKHPHSDSPNLPAAEDNFARTIMTYNFLGNSPGTMMGYDLMALHYLYGARPSRTGNDSYVVRAARSISTASARRSTSRRRTRPSRRSGIPAAITRSTYPSCPRARAAIASICSPLGWISTGAAYQTTYFVAGLSLGPNVSVRRFVSSVSNDTVYANSEANVFAGYASNRVTGNDAIHGADGRRHDRPLRVSTEPGRRDAERQRPRPQLRHQRQRPAGQLLRLEQRPDHHLRRRRAGGQHRRRLGRRGQCRTRPQPCSRSA